MNSPSTYSPTAVPSPMTDQTGVSATSLGSLDSLSSDSDATVIHIPIPVQGPRPAAGLPPILQLKDLPGHMGMHRLIDLGVVRPLDDYHAYHTSYGQSVAGRVAVAQRAIPAHVPVCALTACWVWIGGEMPNSIDVISASHFRSTIFGRKIRVFNRQTPEDQCTVVYGLSLTTPVRTACDVATLPDNEWQGRNCAAKVRVLMNEYEVSPAACLNMLSVNRFWSNTPRAKRFFTKLTIDEEW